MTKKNITNVEAKSSKIKTIKDRKVSFLMAARQCADKLHQQNIQMIQNSDMSKKEKALALKRIKAAYCR